MNADSLNLLKMTISVSQSLSICQSVYLSLSLSYSFSPYVSICLSLSLSFFLSMTVSSSLSDTHSLSLSIVSVCLSAHMSVHFAYNLLSKGCCYIAAT